MQVPEANCNPWSNGLMHAKVRIFSNIFYTIYRPDLFVLRKVMLSTFTKFYSPADNHVGLIYENF